MSRLIKICQSFSKRFNNCSLKYIQHSAEGWKFNTLRTLSTAVNTSPPNPPKNDKPKETSNNRNIFYGVIFLTLTLAVVYKMDLIKYKEDKPKKKKVIKPIKFPPTSADIPSKIPYLLIGGGTASFAAFRAIKSNDSTAKVLVISNEQHYPYMRPPLSKEIWLTENPSLAQKLSFKQWNGSERSLFYEPEDFYVDCKKLEDSPNGGVAVARGWDVVKIDPIQKKAILSDGYEIEYGKCLIATGASPKNLSIFEKASKEIKNKITVYRSIHNFEELDSICKKYKNITIIGGGFLGSELACSLGRKGKNEQWKITQIFRENGNMGKVLPGYLSFWTTEKVKDEGVNVIPNCEVKQVRLENGKLKLSLTDNKEITTDHVIVAVGVKPNTQLAETSDLEIDMMHGGFLVNTELQARSNLYIAGDCACFYDTKLGRRRVEHHDHAVVSGRLAGENMTGASKPYLHQSMFWSDLGPDVGYEAIGIVDSSLPTVGVFAKATEKDNPQGIITTKTDTGMRSEIEAKSKPVKPASEKMKLAKPFTDEDYGKGVIFYLRDKKVVGIVLWNVFNRMSVARQVLRENKEYEDLNEVAKLFNIHDE